MAILIVLIVAIAVAIWLSGKIAGRQALDEQMSQWTSDAALPVDAQDFLRTLDDRLDLPAGVRAQIRAELADHLQDSIASIETEGLERERATREALARLGRPEELARQLREAHQSTRRLLAGAAGGVFQAGVGFFWGAIVGYALVILGFIIVAILISSVLKPPIDFIAGYLPRFSTDSNDLATNSAFTALVACVAAGMAGRRSVRTLALFSRRPARSVGLWWALVGALGLGYLILFVVTAQQSWLAVGVELAVPFAFAVGALFRTDRVFHWARLKGVVLVLVVIGFILPFALLSVATFSGSSATPVGTPIPAPIPESVYWTHLPPASSDETFPVGLSGGSTGQPIINQAFEYIDQGKQTLASFQDLRVEVWRGIEFPGRPGEWGDYVPDPAYSQPYASSPAALTDDGIAVHFDMSHVRNSRWVILLAGEGTDGHLYRLSYPAPWGTSFSGTVWDWITAGG